MERRKVIERIAIVLVCLLVLASVGLNIYLHQKLRKLSLENAPQLAARNETVTPVPETAVQEIADAILPAVREATSDDNIDDLEEQLAAIEEELDKANNQLSDKRKKEAEKREKEEELQRFYMDSLLDSQYADLFEELNLSPEKLEKFKDIYLGKTMAMRGSYSDSPIGREATQEEKTEIKKRTDKIKEEYETKFKELLGEADYEKYTAYTERTSSRAQVTNFKRILGADDMLTKDQEKALIEIMYNEQEKATNEIVRNQPTEPAPEMNENTMSEQLKNTETVHSKMIASAKDTLSPSQLEALTEYLKNQREMMEMSYSVQMSIENTSQDN